MGTGAAAPPGACLAMRGLPADLFRRSPEEGVRLLAQHYIDEAFLARQRLGKREDGEALHDFRVGLRRLRSCCRAYRPYLRGAAPKRMRRRLRALTAATNPGRDLEVQLEWLRAQEANLQPRERIGLNWMIHRLEERERETRDAATLDVGQRFDRIADKLQDRLSRVLPDGSGGDHPPAQLREATGDLIRREAALLSGRLLAVQASGQKEEAHQARITAKRLRYLIEPLALRRKRAKALVKRLKEIQDLLGDLRDLQVLAEEVSLGVEVAAVQRARQLHALALASQPEAKRWRTAHRRDERTGLIALGQLIRARSHELFARAEADWLDGNAQQFLEHVDAFGASVARTRSPHHTVTRTFLLSGSPESLAAEAATSMELGWVPGTEFDEWIGLIRKDGGVRYRRTINPGLGHQAEQISEETTQAVFDALWPLTVGQRTRKIRFHLPHRSRVWHIDRYDGRDLTLARVEARSESAKITFPRWLRGHVVREVTDDEAFQDRNLAS